MNYTFAQYQESADYIRSQIGGFAPKVAMILGSGLGYMGDIVENPIAVPYQNIPHFKVSTAPGHKGQLVFGTLEGQKVAVMQGRMHHYEGYSYEEVSYAVRVLRLLGCDTLIVTNAAGCVNLDWKAGDLMLIADHIKFFMESPLRGENLPEFGVRFPDASHLYTPALREMARQTARELGIELRRASTCTSPAPSTRLRRRCGPPGCWAPTQRACPPRRRSSPPATVACGCWALPSCPTWAPVFWTSPSPSRRCWMRRRPAGTSSPASCWPA